MDSFLAVVAARAEDLRYASYSPAARARALDVTLLGFQLSRSFESLALQAKFRQLWQTGVVPHAIVEDEWQFGATVLIHDLQSAAAMRFNSRLARISSHTCQDGRWELIVDGPDGLGTVNLRPANMGAPPSVVSVLQIARRLPCVIQVTRKSPGPAHTTSLSGTEGMEGTVGMDNGLKLGTMAETARRPALVCMPCTAPTDKTIA